MKAKLLMQKVEFSFFLGLPGQKENEVLGCPTKFINLDLVSPNRGKTSNSSALHLQLRRKIILDTPKLVRT